MATSSGCHLLVLVVVCSIIHTYITFQVKLQSSAPSDAQLHVNI